MAPDSNFTDIFTQQIVYVVATERKVAVSESDASYLFVLVGVTIAMKHRDQKQVGRKEFISLTLLHPSP